MVAAGFICHMEPAFRLTISLMIICAGFAVAVVPILLLLRPYGPKPEALSQKWTPQSIRKLML
jgi:hypothetical protein